MRQQAMEKLSDTQKRKEATGTAEQDKRTTKKSRRSGSEAIEFLRNQSEQEWRVKDWEIEYERVRSENVLKRHESLMHMMVQQQQQAANFQAVMAQQNQSLMTLMSQIMKKCLNK